MSCWRTMLANSDLLFVDSRIARSGLNTPPSERPSCTFLFFDFLGVSSESFSSPSLSEDTTSDTFRFGLVNCGGSLYLLLLAGLLMRRLSSSPEPSSSSSSESSKSESNSSGFISSSASANESSSLSSFQTESPQNV